MPLRRDIVVFVAGLIAAAGGLVGAAYLGSRNAQEANNDEMPVRKWVSGLSQLGITAIYPAREDFYVGDVYVTDFAPGGGLLNRTMKIAHVDTTEAIENAYTNVPSFPDTPEGYDARTIVKSTDNIFQPPKSRTTLPIVSFPEISVSVASAQSGGAGLVGKVSDLFGFTNAAATTMKIRVPGAETYSLPTGTADQMFRKFCQGEDGGQPNPVCTEKVVREQLFSKVGPDVLCRNEPGLTASDTARKPDPIGLSFVYSVYLARSIDYQYGADTSVAATARAVMGEKPGQDNTRSAGTPSSQDTLASVAQAAASQIDNLNQGGHLQIASVTRNGVVLKSIFARPVVIGYVGLWRPPLDPNGECYSKSSSVSSND